MVTIQRELLLEALQKITGIINTNSIQPILSHVLFTIDPATQSAVLTTTDSYLTLSIKIDEDAIKIDAALSGPLESTLPGRKWLDIVKNLPPQSVISINKLNDQIILKTTASTFKLPTLSSSLFPKINLQINIQSDAQPNNTQDFTFECSMHYLRDALQKTHFSMATQESRYQLNGLLLVINSDQLTLVAMDGYRLATIKLTVSTTATVEQRAILPRRSVLELLRLLKEREVNLKITFTQYFIFIEIENLQFISRLLEGQFPDYGRSMPLASDIKTTINISNGMLRASLLRIATMTHAKHRGIRLLFKIDSSELILSTNNLDTEFAEETVSVDYQQRSTEDLTLGLNIDYLLALTQIPTDKEIWQILIQDAQHAIQFQLLSDADLLYAIMPMRL